jgi:hypothetical protein
LLVPQVAQDVLDEHLSLTRKIGREADARKRTEHIVQMTLARELDHAAGRSVMQARVFARIPYKVRGALTRGEQIEAMHECRGADFRPRIIYARKLVNGRYTEVVIDVICANKYL